MADVVRQYEDAERQKQALEDEIEAVASELTSGANAPGLHGALVDAEGFPRADIDVYRVRHQRHRLACLQTDYKEVMKRIEALLPQVFAAKGPKQEMKEVEMKEEPEGVVAEELKDEDTSSSTPKQVMEATREESRMQPFAVVDSVQVESPADLAGLQARDQLVKFGTADASNHRELAAVRDIVQRNVGSSVRVLVRREQQVLALELTPKSWRGPGVLGCLLLPM